jgi:hypothetical protein
VAKISVLAEKSFEKNAAQKNSARHAVYAAKAAEFFEYCNIGFDTPD